VLHQYRSKRADPDLRHHLQRSVTIVKKVKGSYLILQEKGQVSVEWWWWSWCRAKLNGVELEHVAENKPNKLLLVRHGQQGEILTRQVMLLEDDDRVDLQRRKKKLVAVVVVVLCCVPWESQEPSVQQQQ
jgi:hypothetical protein